jgi:hypothetical protein
LEEPGHWECAVQGYILSPDPSSLSLCFLAAMWQAVFPCYVVLAMMYCLTTGLKSTGLSNQGLIPLKLRTKINLSSF